ncbi:MAG TPA: acyl carrier protein [Blastocatellia bacterium]|nr:acyl carrier protein [Blastocatellia bacterium]
MSDLLAEYIRTHAPHLASEVTEDTPLLEQGLLDSLGLMKLIAFLEHRHQLVVPEEEITPDNFRSLGAIRKLIESLSDGTNRTLGNAQF